ncbi:MAG TPA: plastocyanin/azurin family copper-binding protein, partial [Solirubrobacter sp.]|nr:plastocyanin/azurin family copper-binding protein [Solirubrobacter sp.]
MGKRYLPWMACAAIAVVSAPAFAFGKADDPTTSAELVAHDGDGGAVWFQDAASASTSDHTVEIVAGQSVKFSFPGPGTIHNVAIPTTGGTQPTTCNQTKLANTGGTLDRDGKLPMPELAGGLPGWEGYCTFDTPGTYTLVCAVHEAQGMFATVIVAEPTATPTATATTTPEPTATPT